MHRRLGAVLAAVLSAVAVLCTFMMGTMTAHCPSCGLHRGGTGGGASETSTDDDPPSSIGSDAPLPSLSRLRQRLLMAPPRDATESLRDDALQRTRHWFACINSSRSELCRPPLEAWRPRGALPYTEWKTHVAELLQRTSRFRSGPGRRIPPFAFSDPAIASAGYGGPWIENHFISEFEGKLDLFYPLVPLLAQWTDVLWGPDAALAAELLGILRNSDNDSAAHPWGLKPDVLYATVMQLDGLPEDGLPGCGFLRRALVFSASGWGNVPLPLIKGFHWPHNHEYYPPETDPVTAYRRRFVVAWMGDEGKHRYSRFRSAMEKSTLPLDSMMLWPEDVWQWQTHAAVFIVVQPTSLDRAAFRTAEVLQYGRIPLVLIPDGEEEGEAPWVPYRRPTAPRPPLTAVNDGGSPSAEQGSGSLDGHAGALLNGTNGSSTGDPQLWTKVLNSPGSGMWGPGGLGFVLRYRELPSFLCIACDFFRPGSAARWRWQEELSLHRYALGANCPCTDAAWRAMPGQLPGPSAWLNLTLPADSLLYEMERRVLGVAPSYFTYEGVVGQLRRFLVSPAEAELQCVPRPLTAQPPP